MAKKVRKAAGVQPDEPEPKAWRQNGNGYEFVTDGVAASLTPDAGKWRMQVTIGGQRYAGTRDTLEEAFKATDKLMYQNARDAWLGSNCAVVIAPWQGDLTC